MLKTENINGHLVVHFTGIDKITALNAEQVKKELNALYNQKNIKLVIDLDNISFVDSTGFGAFLSVMKTAQGQDGELKICNVNQDILKLFKLLHLDNVFELYGNLDECVA